MILDQQYKKRTIITDIVFGYYDRKGEEVLDFGCSYHQQHLDPLKTYKIATFKIDYLKKICLKKKFRKNAVQMHLKFYLGLGNISFGSNVVDSEVHEKMQKRRMTI